MRGCRDCRDWDGEVVGMGVVVGGQSSLWIWITGFVFQYRVFILLALSHIIGLGKVVYFSARLR